MSQLQTAFPKGRLKDADHLRGSVVSSVWAARRATVLHLLLVKIHLACELTEGSEKSCSRESCLQTKNFPNLFDQEIFPPYILHPAGYLCGCRRPLKVFRTRLPSASKSFLLIPLPQAPPWALATSFPASSCRAHRVAFVQAVPARPFT